MVKITSAASATARGVSPQRIPRSSSHCAFDFVFSRSSHILANLPQVSMHGSTRCFRVAVDNAFKDTLVMDLAALGASLSFKNLFALFTQQINNRVYQDQNKRVLGGLRQRLVKIVV